MSQTALGTVSVTNGSATVVGDVTCNWASVVPGAIFTLSGSNVWYQVLIATFVGGTHWECTLTGVYTGTTAAAQAYVIHTSFTPVKGIPYPEQGDVQTASLFKRAMLTLEGFFTTYGFIADTRQSVAVINTLATGDMYGIEQASAAQTGDFKALRQFTANVANAYLAWGKYTTATAFTEYMRLTQAGGLLVKFGLLSNHATLGMGYTTGAGGTITQATSRVTGVTKNNVSGTITLFSTTIAADTAQSFTFTNSAIAAGDFVLVKHVSGGTVGLYTVVASAETAGSCTITIRNISPSITPTEAPVIQFFVLKSSNS